MRWRPFLEHSKTKPSKSEGGPRALLRNRFGALTRDLPLQDRVRGPEAHERKTARSVSTNN